jgi:dipeptidyl-peptidase-4
MREFRNRLRPGLGRTSPQLEDCSVTKTSTAQRATVLLWILALVLAPPLASEEVDRSRLTLERIFGDEAVETKRFGPARWLADGSGYTLLETSSNFEEAKDIVRYDPATGEGTVLVPASSLVPAEGKDPLSISDYHWSDDGTQLLIFTNTKRVWRRNTRGDYWLLDVGNGELQKLGGDAEESTMMFAKLSPDGTRVAWVDFNDHDLFVQDLETLAVTRLTNDVGEHIINGTSDWVYEEEFGLRDGFRWSPDGKHIAYWQFDSEGVEIFNLINNTDTLYPKLTPIPYPKVGTTNSACRVGVIPAGGGETTWFEPDGDPRNHYIPKMGWAESPDEIWLIQLNRLQNTARVMLGSLDSGALRTVFTDTDAAWIDMRYGDPQWTEDGDHFSWLSERDGWRHLYLVSRDGKEQRLVTVGDYDITEAVNIDDAGGWAYVMASPEDPTSRFLFRASLSGSGTLERVTPPGPAGSHSYQISDDGRWAFHTFSSREQVPKTELVSLPDHTVQRVLEDNTEAREFFETIAKVPSETFRVTIDDGVEVDGWMIKPTGFDPTMIYPLLIYVYGEPGGQTVQNRWGRSSGLWHLYLAQQGYIVASLDSRGTPAPRGRDWRKSIYRQVGTLTSIDLAAAVEAMFDRFAFIDRERVGVWGWSGGGSTTLNVLFRYPEIFSMGISVAPVPDQRLYDTIYQERYMGLPDDNADGYEEGSPITHAAKLEGDLLLIHGTADDNVHYQGSERLINELIKHGKLFEMMSYPNRSHGISEGEGTSLHVRRTMTRFLEEHLEAGPKPMPPPKQPEATSFLGEPLFAPAPSKDALAKYEEARKSWEASPTSVDAIIWYGRRTAYLGRYRDAIRVYSDGIELHPEDARLYRHRGHRFISTRQLEKAIADLDYAATLIEDAVDEVEPDGLPNALGIPVSTLHSNIWYHLGLAYYLAGDYERAEQAYAQRAASAANNDMLVSTAHWHYMTLRRLGREEEAIAVLAPITADMEIIENRAYHRLCLFYKGELEEADLLTDGSSPSDAAIAYGVANWHLANGDTERGTELLEEIVARGGWAAFGFIAAEADLDRLRNEEADNLN